eukprot:gene768-5058_t
MGGPNAWYVASCKKCGRTATWVSLDYAHAHMGTCIGKPETHAEAIGRARRAAEKQKTAAATAAQAAAAPPGAAAAAPAGIG